MTASPTASHSSAPTPSSWSSSSVASSVSTMRCLQPATHLVNGAMESTFFRLGHAIGRYPWATIAIAMLLCLTLGGGLFFWTEEHDAVALWTTQDSRVRLSSEWVNEHFSDDVRYESVIISASGNVLRPQVLVQMAEMDAVVRNLSTPDGHRWNDLCARFGTTLMKTEDGEALYDQQQEKRRRRRRRRRQADNETWWYGVGDLEENGDVEPITEPADINGDDLDGLDFSRVFGGGGGGGSANSGGSGSDYGEGGDVDGGSDLIDPRALHLIDLMSQPDNCLVRSILQIWDSDLERIRELDERQILRDVNDALRNGAGASDVESLEFLLSDVRRDANGSVVFVGATLMTWMLDRGQMNYSVRTVWEKEFIQVTLHGNFSWPHDVHLYSLASHSYVEGIAETLTSNFTVLMAGFSLIIFYFSFAMGKFNVIEQRLVLSIVGVSVVGQAILASYGLCFYFGVFYGPVHPTIPFLLLGIGVDDMFVIIQELDNLTEEEKRLPIPERMARALKHAGVSITVTSVTDIAAFAIGATTNMPALRSFCINAMAGILMLFILEVTFFVALTVLDERRKENRQVMCCIRKSKDWTPPSFSQRELLKLFFERYYGPFLLKTPVKVLVLTLTAAFVGVNAWGILQLEQNFDPNWYLKENSYPSEFFDAMKTHFPENGERASIYTGRIDYIGQRDELNRMAELLRTNPFIHPNSVIFWYDDFQNWLNRTKQVEFPDGELRFKELLQEYLFSPEGRTHLQDIKVEGSIVDLDGNFNITGSRARFHHLSLKNSSAKNEALESITALSDSIDFGADAQPSHPVVYTDTYVEWEANRVISKELIRNLGLTMAAVVSVTLVLICDLVTVFWVFTCIAFTLIDLLGLMYFWGLTVEISSSIIVILAAGLAIDYSAHIGHTFTTVHGSKSTRAKVTLIRMGPAVWNGGFSTFLAFVLLINTDSHIFTTFFKLFFGVVVFGLFHGLAYLPVVLSCFGPAEITKTSGSIDSIATEFSLSPSSTSSSGSPTFKPASQISSAQKSPLDPLFVSDIQIIYCDDSTASKMSGQQRLWRAKDQSAPYIPQPDYTPLPARRSGLLPTGVQLSAGDLAGKSAQGAAAAAAASSLATLPRLDDKSKPAAYYTNRAFDAAVPESFAERAWNSAQWSSSQFSVSDWSVALMQKQLCLEAKTRRDERIRSAADKTLESFEKEMDLYLDDDDEDQHEQDGGRAAVAAMKAAAAADSGVSSGITPSQSSSSLSSSATPTTTTTSTTGSLSRQIAERLPSSTNGAPSSSVSSPPVAPDSSPSSSTTSGSGGRSRPLRNSRDRDQISLESGYMSSYPGDAQQQQQQQRHHHHNGAAC